MLRLISRIIEYDFWYLKLEFKPLHSSIDIHIKRKGDTDFFYIKSIPNQLTEIMTCDTLLQGFMREHALGNKVKEYLRVSVTGVFYDSISFNQIPNSNFLNVEYAMGSPTVIKKRYFVGNYYDLNNIFLICNGLLTEYKETQKTIIKEKEHLAEKKKPKKKIKI